VRRIPVLWLVEHLAREMDATCAAVGLLRQRYGIHAEIWHMYRDAGAVLSQIVPEVVVHPFFYFADGALATEDFVACWPRATHFTMAWEQLHYPAHQTSKAPADAFAREQVLHHAWGGFYHDYLTGHGVPTDNIFVNGHPAYALYFEPYRRYYKTRQQLASAYGLDEHARWVFVPENYRWAFLTDKRLAAFESWGGNRAEATALREFSRQSLAAMLEWCAALAQDRAVELIFRTRPSTGESQMQAFVHDVLGRGDSRMRFIKKGSVREWILAADVVVSSYSTSLIEAALAGKKALMAEPLPIPPALQCDWYDLVPSLTTREAFVTACLEPGGPPPALAEWARREMLGRGDPIERLAAHVATLVQSRRAAGDGAGKAEAHARAAVQRLPRRNYFNQTSHDQDVFDQPFIEEKIGEWTRILTC
jgi:surface carbohydrate biosynthesis protein